MGLPQALEDQFNELHTLYHEDKLLHCSRILTNLKSEVAQGDPSSNPSVQEELQKRLASQFIQQVQAECAQVAALKKALNDQENWTLSYDGIETKVWYRRESDTSTHSLRIEGTIRAPLINVASLLYESDLYERLFWFVTSSKTLKVDHPSMMKRAVHIRVHVPWPLSDRDVTLFAFATDALQYDGDESGGTLIASSHSVCKNDPVPDVPPPEARVIRADFKTSGFELRPVTPTETHARFLYNCDPKLMFIPITVVNWAARTFCRWSLRILEARACNLEAVSSEYAKRIETAPVYETIRTRLKNFWDSKGVSFDTEDKPVTVAVRTSADFNADARPEFPTSIVTSLLTGGPGPAENSGETGGLRKRLTAKLFGSAASAEPNK